MYFTFVQLMQNMEYGSIISTLCFDMNHFFYMLDKLMLKATIIGYFIIKFPF